MIIIIVIEETATKKVMMEKEITFPAAFDSFICLIYRWIEYNERETAFFVDVSSETNETRIASPEKRVQKDSQVFRVTSQEKIEHEKSPKTNCSLFLSSSSQEKGDETTFDANLARHYDVCFAETKEEIEDERK